MTVEFVIDVEKVSKSKLILEAVMEFFGSNKKAEALAMFATKGPKKAFEVVRKATEPTHVRYDSIIDGKTTAGCRELNGRTWKIGEPGIVWTPRHWNCRAQNTYVRL